MPLTKERVCKGEAPTSRTKSDNRMSTRHVARRFFIWRLDPLAFVAGSSLAVVR